MAKKTEYRQRIKHTMISIDLDYLDEAELANVLKLLKKNHFTKNIWFDLSPGGKGFHIQAWCEPRYALTQKQSFCLRRLAGDDLGRIFLDAMGERQLEVLFDTKKSIKHEI